MPRLSRRRRVVLLVLVSLLAGMAVNVAIAWGSMWLAHKVSFRFRQTKPTAWRAPVPATWPAPKECVTTSWPGIDSHLTFALSNHIQGVYECGWPMRSLQGWSLFWPPEEPPSGQTATQTASPRVLHEDHYLLGWGDREFPLLPMWPGFLINTLLYACIPLAILFGPRQIRRLSRRRRGACLRCGYDLRGLSEGVCPECGSGP